MANLNLLALLPLAIAGTSFRLAGSISGQGSFNGQGTKDVQGSRSSLRELGGSGSESSCSGLNPTGTPSLSSGIIVRGNERVQSHVVQGRPVDECEEVLLDSVMVASGLV